MPPNQYPNPGTDFYFRQPPQVAPNFQPQYQHQPQPYQQPYQHQPQFVTRFVGSIDEAKAAMIDALSTYLFINQNTGHIYMKRLSNNGLSEFYTYEISDGGNRQESQDPVSEIRERLSSIEHILGEMSHGKSVSGNAVNEAGCHHAATGAADDGAGAAAEPAAFPKVRGNDRWKK